jgi:hypothetical protein
MRFLFTFLILFINFFSFSQNISVVKIEEFRSDVENILSNVCKIELKISGDELLKYTNIRLGSITRAVDDQESNLYKISTWGNRYKKIGKDGSVEIEIQKAAREAKLIKELEGEIYLYAPSGENESEIRINEFRAKTNENFLPTNFPLKLYYLTRNSLGKFKAETLKKKSKYLNNLPEDLRKLSDLLVGIFEDLEDFGDENRDIVFLRDGDEQEKDKLIDIYFLDENNNKIEKNGLFSGGPLITYTFPKDINPNWSMVINIETEPSIQKIPFKFENLKLP